MIAGKDGVDCLVRGLEDQPIRFYFTVPPLCGLTPEQEPNIPASEDYLALLRHPKCLGVGEVYWSNILLEGHQGERVRELASMALDIGKRVEGHSAGARGRKLQAYTCFGISSCHEPITEGEVLERLRLGYWVMIREGAIRKELEELKGIFKRDVDFRRLVLTTDGMDPEGFLKDGYLDTSLRRALRLGAPPALAYQMVTLNVAEHFRLDHLIGAVAPGRSADILIIPSPDTFSPKLIMCDGDIIFEDGEINAAPTKVTFPSHMFKTVKVPHFMLPPLPRKGQVRVLDLVSRLVTKERILDLGNPEESRDVVMVLALDRLGSGKGFTGLLKGYGLRRGAVGSTMCWDTGDMIVAGCDPQSMKTVAGRLQELGGGAVYSVGEEIVAEFPAPLCGVISLEPMQKLAEEIQLLDTSLKNNGVRWDKPLLTIDTLGTAAIPHMRMTHDGYIRLKDRTILPVEV
jgi:adenine deaminase